MSEDLGMTEAWGHEAEEPNWDEEAQRPPSTTQASRLLEALSSADDMECLQALSQLAVELSMVQEDSISNYPIPHLIPLLVQCLQRDSIPDLMLYAITCIINLLDTLPNLAKVFVTSGAIPAICSKLTSLDFIDLAEGAIKALEKLGYESAQVILQEGVLSTLVELIYFFDVDTQKRIMRVLTMLGATATNQELFTQYVEPALPSLMPHLNSDEGSPLTEFALQFFHVLIDAVGESGESPGIRADCLYEKGLLTSLIELLQTRLDLTGKVFGVLERMATNSANVAEGLLNFGIISYISQNMGHEIKDFDKIKEALGLINALLPEQSSEDFQFRIDFYRSNPQFVDSMAELVIPRVLSSFDKIDHRSIKNKSLKAFDSLLTLGTVETLTALIDPTVFASFVQELLYSSDRSALRISLNIVLTAYNKLPSQFVKHFVREGVVEKLKELSKPPIREENEKPHSIKTLLVDHGVPEGSPLFDHIVSTMEEQGEARPRTPESIETRRSRMGTELKRTYTTPLTVKSVLEKHNIRKELLAEKKPWEQVRSHNDIFKQAKQCLKLHEQCGEASESSILIQLTAICHKLDTGDSVPALEDLKVIFEDHEGVTSSEVFQSQLPASLFKWLSLDSANARLLKETLPQLTLCKLVKLLILSLKFTESFTVNVRESRGNPIHSLAAIASNSVIVIRFQDEASDDQELLERQSHFANNQELQVNVQLFQTLETIAEKLLSFSKPEELQNLFVQPSGYGMKRKFAEQKKRESRQIEGFDVTQALRELGMSEVQEDLVKDMEAQHKQEVIEQMIKSSQEDAEAEREELARHMAEIVINSRPLPNLQVEFTHEGKPLSNWTFISALLSTARGEEKVILDFKYVPKQMGYPTAYVDSEDSYRQCITEACEVGLPPSSEVYGVLRLIKLLNILNSTIKFSIPSDTFYSAKLSSSIARQSEEANMMLTDTSPEWVNSILRSCQFLFPFELRLNVLRRTNFTGLAIQQMLSSYRGRAQVEPIGKRKFTIKRTDVLQEALRIFNDPRSIRNFTLEFDYAGEEGTGLGPTLEFYFVLSKEVRSMPVWRNTGEETGLFPAPSSKGESAFWESLGRMIGKALADDRLLELPLSPVLWKLIFRKPIQFSDLEHVDRALAIHLRELLEATRADTDAEPISFRGSSIDDLHLNFTVPGYEAIELKPEGSKIAVQASNLSEYIDLVAMSTLLQTPQAEAIRLGLNSIIDLSKLEFMDEFEIETLLCGSNQEDWDQAVLHEALVPAHGYTKTSETFLNLITAMQGFNSEEQRLFLSFVTGSPRLPIGGFKSLSPPLTVVKKDPTLPGGVPDQYMPSVMTCQNYLKLPDYSSPAVLHRNLLYAMQEGRETFHFS
mmetsp:Transcript_8059/g.15832  ORF Transcript_8059/g.15832 Transcript_8059/m.15832 type:complete len:1364 (+) Transcript_8059:41-4132(+)